MNLLEEYGYCVIPKGTVLYRQGVLCHRYGCFFALHPRWAINFSGENKAPVRAWIVEDPITVLFAISHLNPYGFGQCALSDIYRKHFDTSDGLSSLDVKQTNKKARGNLQRLLQIHNIEGWLSTIEDKPPLEVFLMPGVLEQLESIPQNMCNESQAQNSLRMIQIFPIGSFFEVSFNHLERNWGYLCECHKHVEEDWYSVLQKIVFNK